MRLVLLIAVLVLVAVSAAAVAPVAEPFRRYLPQATLGLAIVVLLAVFAQPRLTMPSRPPAAEPARPAPLPPQASKADAEIVQFLAMLQEKGRLVDFLMDDINAYNDSQVGAAARVVHAGCKGVLQDHFTIDPLRPEQEGSTVQVPAGYSADEYRLVGKIARVRALLWRAGPPRLENGYGEAATVAARRGRQAARHSARRGGREMRRPKQFHRDRIPPTSSSPRKRGPRGLGSPLSRG